MPDATFEILEHTADVGFRATGASEAELFANAAWALLSFTEGSEGDSQERSLEIHGEDRESLMINWLSELLYLFDSGEFVPSRISVREISPDRLVARLGGAPRRIAAWRLIVKAVTYHLIEVKESGGRWEATVYLDV